MAANSHLFTIRFNVLFVVFDYHFLIGVINIGLGTLPLGGLLWTESHPGTANFTNVM